MEAWNVYKYISKMETTKKMEKLRQENANDEC